MISQFKKVKKNKDLFLVLQRQNLLPLLYRQSYVDTKKSIAFHNLYRNPYQAAFFSGASVSVLIQWIEGGFKESEEELADMFIYLMDGHHRENSTSAQHRTT